MATKPISNGEKRTARPVNTGRKQQPRRQTKPASAEPERDKPQVKTAVIVKVDGTDAEVYEQCAKEIPGWDKLAEHTRADVVRLMRQFWTYPVAPPMKLTNEGGVRVIGPPDGANTTLYALRLTETMATSSEDLANERLQEITAFHQAANKTDATGRDVSATLAFMRGANPADTVQSTLALQMAATHDSAMRALAQFAKADFIPQAQLYGTLANKLLNTYTRQAEVLAKLQRGGEQVIKHVHIDNRGGQAVVTDQVVAGGHHGKVGHQPHAGIAALPGADPLGNGVSEACAPGQEAVQASWRAIDGSAQR